MNRFYILLAGLFIFTGASAQSRQDLDIRAIDANNNWLRMENSEGIDQSVLLSSIINYYSLGESSSFDLVKVESDKYGITHYRYDQLHDGVKVKGGQLFIHYHPDGTIKANSRLVFGIVNPSQNVLSENEALQNALDFIGADQYYWEDPAMEEMIKEIKQDQKASFYPKGELVYAASTFDQDGSNYQLVWNFDIYAKGDKNRTFVYVDALSGAISFSQNGINTVASEGVAHTRYHGVRTIIADSVGLNSYRMYDSTRGNGIHTRNLQEGYDTSSDGEYVEFTDTDNIWDNANANRDEVAGDTHWSLEMTYDYYLGVHGLNSYNNNGAQIIANVHWGESESNANWNGYAVNFGDSYVNPFTSIDVVGHEFAHAVTGTAAGLIYEYESGALNESFSDIFGTAIEFWALEDTLKSWKMGMSTFQIRNLADPNQYGDPDTYLGDNWYTGEGDNGGVHINSGVQNFWFYLLSEGGSGINDNGDAYEVEGLGIDVAAEIAFQNLVGYMGNTSNYYDAYEGSVQSAADIYGECSEEVRQTLKAWYAVGIGVNELSKDVGVTSVVLPESSCDLTASESADIAIKYQNVGCGEVLASGSTITVSYQLNDDAAVVSQDITINEDLQSGDTLYYTINNMDLSGFGKYYIDIWASIDEDLIFFNDTVYNQLVVHQVQLASEDIVGFESLIDSPDSFYVEVGANAEARISTVADNTGSRGFKMTGYEADAENLELPSDEEDNFSWNPSYNSKICFCVDASEWNSASLAFDMKQLYSLYWEELYGDNMSEFVTSMRILINGEQVGDQYHPTTETDDPYMTYYVNLDDYAGTMFEACFENKSFIRNAEDPISGSDGDNTYLDNIRFMDNNALSVPDLLKDDQLAVYPNPSNGSFTVEVSDISEKYQISIIDALGKVVFAQESIGAGTSIYPVDISSFTKGIYVVRIQLADSSINKRIVLH